MEHKKGQGSTTNDRNRIEKHLQFNS